MQPLNLIKVAYYFTKMSSYAAAYDSLSSASSTTDVPDGPPQITLNDQDEEDGVSEETIGAALDEYVSASKGGRQAFARGDLSTATTEFNQALNIELQTEMDCLYDNSIGFVSGLVRRGVDSRLQRSPRHQAASENCAKILNQLMEVYEKANKKMDSKPTQARWYLKMGAALCIINEWEKAKMIYAEGINMCKDKKDLKVALKQLTSLEKITASADIPSDSQDGSANTTPSHTAKDKRNGVAAVKSSPRHSPRNSPRHSPAAERRAKRKVSRERSLSSAFKSRSSSESNDEDIMEFSQRKRAGSLTLPGNESSLTSVQNGKKGKGEKRFSMNVFSNKRHSMGLNTLFALGNKRHPVPTIPSDERQAWMECFNPSDCKVVSGSREFVPSAVTHMRKLSSLNTTSGAPAIISSKQDPENSLGSDVFEPRMSFSAVKFTSMKIDSDDSELDDD